MGGRSKQAGRTEAAIAALLSERTHAEAAAKAGLAESTLHRYLKDPNFIRRYRDARRRVLETSVGQLQHATTEAVKTLVAALESPDVNARIRAALGIIDRSMRAVELCDLAEQVAELQAWRKAEEQRRGGRAGRVAG
jgi:hypothetical protein